MSQDPARIVKGVLIMGQRIDRFCEELRLKLSSIDSGFDSLQAKIDGGAQHAEAEVRSHLEKVRGRIEQDRANVAAARAGLDKWAEQRKAATAATIAAWKAKREIDKLQRRAEDAELYAAAAKAIASAAVDEAEQASLEAWLARHDALAQTGPSESGRQAS